MRRLLSWTAIFFIILLWSVGIRPFIPALLPFEPFMPLLVLALMLGPTKLVFPLILFGGMVFDAFQPFPFPVAFYALLLISACVGGAVRFLLAGRSFYSAVLLVALMRALLAGGLYLLGPGAAVWAGDRAVLTSGSFFLVTTLVDAVFLLMGFRLIARPLLGAHRVQIAR